MSSSSNREAPRKGLLANLFTTKLVFWVAALLMCGADLWSKDWAQDRFGITALDESNLEAGIEKRLGEYDRANDLEIEAWPGVLHFKWAENKGAAFSLANGHWGFLIGVGLLTLGVLLWFVSKVPANAVFSLVLLGFIAGGAVGNLYDRITYRSLDQRSSVDGAKNPGFLEPIPAVRDFLYWPFDIPVYSTWGVTDEQRERGVSRKWPIFNIADIGVTGGVAGLLLISLFAREERKPEVEDEARATAS